MGTSTSGNPFAEGMRGNRGNTVPAHLGRVGGLDAELAGRLEDHYNSEATYNDALHKRGAEHLNILHAHASNLYNYTGSPFAASAMESASKALAAHDAFSFNPQGSRPKDTEGNSDLTAEPERISTSFDHVRDVWNSLKQLKSETTVSPTGDATKDRHIEQTMSRAADAAKNYTTSYFPAETISRPGGKAAVAVDSGYRRMINVAPGSGPDAEYRFKTAKYEDARKASGMAKKRPLKTKGE